MLGYHTYSIRKSLTKDDSEEILEDFHRYREKTGNIIIQPDGKPKKVDGSSKDVYPLHKIIFKKDRGVSFIVWRCFHSKKFQYFGIEARINPKSLTGITNYLDASDEEHFEKAEAKFDFIAREISDKIPLFYDYSVKRIDYCINAKLDEIGYKCNSEQLMYLIKQGDIPPFYKERATYDKDKSHRWETDEDSFYLESGSARFNFYRKDKQLEKIYSEKERTPEIQASIEKARNLIRLEYQILPQKMYRLKDELSQGTSYNYSNYAVTMRLLSNEISKKIIMDNYARILRWGNYHTMKIAKAIIKSYKYCPSKEDRLIRVLELVKEKRSIYKARKSLQDDKMAVAEFNRSLKELDNINVNAVTIPRSFKINYIPNILKHYDNMTDGRVTPSKDFLDDYKPISHYMTADI